MPKICYDPKALTRLQHNPARLATVVKANAIIQSYQTQGYDLTLRQLYYQFVSQGLIANKDAEYKKLGDIVGEARMAGLMDWLAIVDRTRYLRDLDHWGAPADIVADSAKDFRIDRWATQPYRIEVWIEKDALVGVIGGICQSLDVPYFSCRGYTSVSEVWLAAQRLLKHRKSGQRVRILHFGDHDPSGIDMTRDITDRLTVFMGSTVKVKRLALNMDQILQYQPPPNPAKVTDSRSKAYIAKYGHESWELDALEPSVLAGLIERAVTRRIEPDAWAAAKAQQVKGRRLLKAVSDRWDQVVETVQ